MNIKLHTPNSLKAGSGMASTKQFMLSLLATTVSIVLTFGTAAVIDHNKKQKEKHEIVMMVIYDMYNSLKTMEEADSMIHHSMALQKQLANDTALFDSIKYEILMSLPIVEYTETTERIFSSNIETINTVGNVLFTENVAEFYQIRKKYKTMVSDSIFNEFSAKIINLSKTMDILDYKYYNYALMSSGFLITMRHLFAQCKQMMDVTHEELETYRKEREQMQDDMSSGEETMQVINEVKKLQNDIDSIKEKIPHSR